MSNVNRSETDPPNNIKQKSVDEYICPHCNKKMNKWQVPPFNFSDGLGWCTDHLYICFNDDCMFFKNSWEHMDTNYGQSMGYRAMIHPDSKESMAVPAGSVDAMKGNILDEIQEAKDKKSIEKRHKSMISLTDAFIIKDIEPIIDILLAEDECPSVRLKAAEMLGDLKNLRALDALLSVELEHETIKEQRTKSIKKIHKANFTRECPSCAEVIKQRAKICKYCSKEVG